MRFHVDLHLYSGYGIRFNTRAFFSINGELGKNASSFGRDKCLSLHTGNRKKDILNLWEGATDVLNDTKITAEAKNSINIKNKPRNFLLLKATVQHCQQFFLG